MEVEAKGASFSFMKKGRGFCMKKQWIVAFALTSLMTMGIIGNSTEAVYAKTEDNYIYNGISIDGIDISGDTKEEAQKKIDTYMNKLKETPIEFKTDLDKVSVSMEEVGLTYTNKEVVEEAFSYGKEGNIIKRYKEKKDIEENPLQLTLDKTISTKKLKQVIKNSEESLVEKAQNASIKRENGAFQVIPEKEGLTIDYDKTAKEFKSYVSETWDGQEDSFLVETKKDEPEYKSADLQEVKDVLGTFTTNYSSSTSDRAQNVATGAAHINGTVLYPGEEFSTYEKVAPYTYENGYRTGKAYSNGEVIDSIGGGICQVSTTLYNAVIRSELEITERYPHSMIVGYVPLAADAAMAGTYKNLKFKNNTDSPIYIEGTTYNRNVTFTIYGKETRASNRKIEFRSETLETYQPGTDIEKEDPTMPVGQSIVTQSAHIGYRAQLWKDIYIDGEKTDSILVNTSTYQSSPRRVTVGTKQPEQPKEEETKEEETTKEETKKEETTKTESSEEKEETTSSSSESTATNASTEQQVNSEE